MYRAPFRPLCAILLASLLVTVACKTAPVAPEFSESSEATAELAQLESDRAELDAVQKQLDADIALAEAGWVAGKPAPKMEASYTSKGGKWDDDEIIETKVKAKACIEKKDVKQYNIWCKKLAELCKKKKQEISKIIVEVEVKIDTAKQKLPDYGDFPKPIPGKQDTEGQLPAPSKNDYEPQLPAGTSNTLPPIPVPASKGTNDPNQNGKK